MKKYFSVLLLLICIGTFAQQITFQGKIYQGGQPVTAPGNFYFIVINSTISWTETHNNVPVNNGLYAVVLGSITPLPLNLFQNSASVEMAVRYNGNWIDTVTLYAPFERDYTVPDSIKDGISWNEVSNKPALDVSNINELQTLSISNDSIYISLGNGVKLPVGNSGGGNSNTVIGNFTVFDTTATVLPNVGQLNNCSQDAFSSTIWQSFLCTSSGKLRYIKVQLGSIASSHVIVNIYTGVGVSQTLAGPLQIAVSGGLSFRTLDVSSLNVALQTGNVYTFSLSPSPNGTQGVVGRNFLTADAYTDGESSYGVNADLCFEIYTDRTNPSSFTILNNGFVGISNNNPTSQLTVAGRIEDATGFVTPVGSIISYGGRTAPKGWLMCDGSSVSRTQYPELFNAIDTSWGSGSTPGVSFSLPDLRGQFLRGVDGLAGEDPDNGASANSGADGKRYRKIVGGNTGNNVGSYQNDQMVLHNHTSSGNIPMSINYPVGPVVDAAAAVGNAGGGYAGTGGGSVYTGRTGKGTETRPQNAYVHYIIKY